MKNKILCILLTIFIFSCHQNKKQEPTKNKMTYSGTSEDNIKIIDENNNEKIMTKENPAVMFSELFEKYKTTEFESRRIEGGPDDGMGILIYDVNKKISNDIFCQFNLCTSMGQTQYLIYKKEGENIWYFNKEVLFYEEAYELENAETINTYFKYINDLPYVYNELTGKYDIQADTGKYTAIVDVGSLEQIIGIVQNAIGDIK